jgi:Domain of unknown function (DUF5658)
VTLVCFHDGTQRHFAPDSQPNARHAEWDLHLHRPHGRVFSSAEDGSTALQRATTRHHIRFAICRGDMMNLQKLLGFNLFLQIFDGTASYFILSRGESELNPFVSAAIYAWGLEWALIYWKVLVCVLLVILYSLKHFRPILPLQGLTFVAIVYSVLGLYLVFHLIHSV